MQLHEFQLFLLQKAEASKDENVQIILRDCVSYSGYCQRHFDLTEKQAIEKTMLYQATRFDVPDEVFRILLGSPFEEFTILRSSLSEDLIAKFS